MWKVCRERDLVCYCMHVCLCVRVCLSVSACMSVYLCVHTHTVCLGTGEGFCFAPSLLVRNIAVMAGNTWHRSAAAIRPTLGRLSWAASAGASRLFCQDSSCQAIQTICSHQQEHPRPKPCRSKASYINGRYGDQETTWLLLDLNNGGGGKGS